MHMLYFNGVIVVEGKTDASFLSSFIKSEYVITKGYELPVEEMAYLNAVSFYKQVLILTDPDDAGKLIRQRIKISNSIQIDVDKKYCSKNNKHGIAECQKEEIIRVLKRYLSENPKNEKKIKSSFLISLGLNSKKERTIFAKKVPVGIVNLNKLSQRLNSLQFDEEKIRKLVEEQ